VDLSVLGKEMKIIPVPQKLSDRIVTSHQVVRRLVADLQLNQSMVHQVY
jgi:hypothetical protein